MSADLERKAREAAEGLVPNKGYGYKAVRDAVREDGFVMGYKVAATLREKEIEELKKACQQWEWNSAESMALVLAHEGKIATQTAEIATLRARVEGMEKVANLADSIAHEFEVAVESRNPVGGMSVPPSGDFISCAQLPSAVGRMRWWAREIRKAQPIPVPETKP